MVKKLHKSDADDSATRASEQLKSVKDSAQQIWQAGLGAFAKAQAEGTRAFEALVKEGSTLQRKTQTAAEDRISEATSRMTSMASDISSKASGHWDKLENIFEDRVSKALNKLGVPSAKDVAALNARIEELSQRLNKKAPAPRPAPKAAAKPSAKPAARKSAAASARPAAKASAKAAPAPGAKRSSTRRG